MKTVPNRLRKFHSNDNSLLKCATELMQGIERDEEANIGSEIAPLLDHPQYIMRFETMQEADSTSRRPHARIFQPAFPSTLATNVCQRHYQCMLLRFRDAKLKNHGPRYETISQNQVGFTVRDRLQTWPEVRRYFAVCPLSGQRSRAAESKLPSRLRTSEEVLPT